MARHLVCRIPFRRATRMRSSRAILLVLLLSFLLDFLSLSRILSRRPPPATVHSPVQRIYITAIHWNNEVVLKSNWNKAVLELAKHLGPENIYISIYESGSWDDSKGALRSLDAELGQLGVPRTVILDETTHADELATPPGSSGWIDTPRGKNELRRIPYLSKLRNTALKPLLALAANGTTFDKLLFLNDVVFTVCSTPTIRTETCSHPLPDRRRNHPPRNPQRRLRRRLLPRLLPPPGLLRHLRPARLRRPRNSHFHISLLSLSDITGCYGFEPTGSRAELLEWHGRFRRYPLLLGQQSPSIQGDSGFTSSTPSRRLRVLSHSRG